MGRRARGRAAVVGCLRDGAGGIVSALQMFAGFESFALIARAEELRIAREAPLCLATRAATQRAMLRAPEGTVPSVTEIAALWVDALVTLGGVSPAADFPGRTKWLIRYLKK